MNIKQQKSKIKWNYKIKKKLNQKDMFMFNE